MTFNKRTPGKLTLGRCSGIMAAKRDSTELETGVKQVQDIADEGHLANFHADNDVLHERFSKKALPCPSPETSRSTRLSIHSPTHPFRPCPSGVGPARPDLI